MGIRTRGVTSWGSSARPASGLLATISRVLLVAVTIALPTPALPADRFVRGDVDANDRIDLTDAVRVFQFLFLGDHAAVECVDAGDADDTGALNITDGIYVLNFLFLAGPAPSPPFPDCGVDPTADTLACERFPRCDAQGATFMLFGCAFEADGVFFLVDRSGGGRSGLNAARPHMINALSSFAADVEFGIFAFDQGLIAFPDGPDPARATPDVVDSAIELVQSLGPGRGTCPLGALKAALEMAGRSEATDRVLVFVSDGVPTCPGHNVVQHRQEILQGAVEQNTERIPIHTFGVGEQLNERFLRQLASDSGGEYVRVTE